MEIGDTVCNTHDYNKIGEAKGICLYYDMNRIWVKSSNHKLLLQTYLTHYHESRIVLFEKYTRIGNNYFEL